jgi:hypothetical protein
MTSAQNLRRWIAERLNSAVKNSATLRTLLVQQRARFDESRIARITGYAERLARRA